jgi:hypothetical protein
VEANRAFMLPLKSVEDNFLGSKIATIFNQWCVL